MAFLLTLIPFGIGLLIGAGMFRRYKREDERQRALPVRSHAYTSQRSDPSSLILFFPVIGLAITVCLGVSPGTLEQIRDFLAPRYVIIER